MPVQMQLLRVVDGGGTVSVGDIAVSVEPVSSVVSTICVIRTEADVFARFTG